MTQQAWDRPERIWRRGVVLFLLVAAAILGPALYSAWCGSRVAAQGLPAAQPPVVQVPGTAPATPAPPIPSQPAVPVTEVKSPAAPAHYSDQAIWALIVSFLLQYLKRAGWFPWLTEASSARLKAQFGFVAALLTAAGVHFAVSGSVFDDGGASITITGFSLAAVKDVVWQWAAQQAWYKLAVKEQAVLVATVTAPRP